MRPARTTDAASRPAPARRRRWWIGIGMAVVALAIYAALLGWATRRLQIDVQNSIRPVPAVVEAGRGGG